MATYRVTTKLGTTSGESLVVESAAEALRTVRELSQNRFSATVFDEGGRECSIEEVKALASAERLQR